MIAEAGRGHCANRKWSQVPFRTTADATGDFVSAEHGCQAKVRFGIILTGLSPDRMVNPRLGHRSLRDAKGTSNVLRDDLKFQGISEYTLFLNIRAKAVITHNPPG